MRVKEVAADRLCSKIIDTGGDPAGMMLNVVNENDRLRALCREAAAVLRQRKPTCLSNAVSDQSLAERLEHAGGTSTPDEQSVETTNMNGQQTAIRPARDWKRLKREGQAGGYTMNRSNSGCSMLAVFICDNTADSRAPITGDMSAYQQQVDRWLEAGNA